MGILGKPQGIFDLNDSDKWLSSKIDMCYLCINII